MIDVDEEEEEVEGETKEDEADDEEALELLCSCSNERWIPYRFQHFDWTLVFSAIAGNAHGQASLKSKGLLTPMMMMKM